MNFAARIQSTAARHIRRIRRVHRKTCRDVHEIRRSMTARRSTNRSDSRRALTNVGGACDLVGDSRAAQALAQTLAVPSAVEAETETLPHVHGFHSYPARLHPVTARRLIEAFSHPRETILDPFCGSGTVLVEARLAGRGAVGIDANPIAVRLSNLKAQGRSEAERRQLVLAAHDVAALADQRRQSRAGASRRFAAEDVALFDPHVLMELDGLRVAIDAIAGAERTALRADLEMVLSAILTKLSRRSSETSMQKNNRRIAPGFPTRTFARKAEELAERLAAIWSQLHSAPQATAREGDARELPGVSPASIDLVVTSPPYPGVYDYLAHHAARLRWLRLKPSEFDRAELGSRRRLEPMGPEAGAERWRRELKAVLNALFRVLRPEGAAVLMIADSVLAGRAVYALELLQSIGPETGFQFKAAASQVRPHFHRPTAAAFDRPRREHAILLVRHANPLSP